MRKLILMFALSFFIFSCNEEDNETNLTPELTTQDEFMVIEDVAYEIAENIDWSIYLSETTPNYRSTGKQKKKVSEFKSFKDEETNLGNLLYIANYSDNSFVLISGDTRLTPILAFSEEGNFPLDSKVLPGGLIDWLNEAERNIVRARTKNLKQDNGTKLKWEYVISPNRVDPIGNGCPDEWFITKNPLLATAWGQWHGYNNFAPDHSCGSVNGNVPSGCVATAMSQIMRYHEHPTGYNYAIMPNTRNAFSPPWNSAGFNEVSQLMLDAANSVGMDWGCDGSSANTEDARGALINTFGYSSNARYIDYNSTKFKAEINANRPVILRGATENCFLGIFCWGEDGHAWVADGYKDSYTCVEDDNGECLGCWGRFWLHMNWGWNDYGNGWYTDFRVDNNDYTYDKEMIYRITP